MLDFLTDAKNAGSGRVQERSLPPHSYMCAVDSSPLNLNSKIALVPYLVAFISLENVLVITQSVISTPAHLDVKIRIAQGVSREGWSITKNLFAEITILSFIFLLGTFEASLQEFCHLTLMGLISDFFLQIS